MVLLHGLGASSHYWDLVLDRLDGFGCVAPDLLGFGRSPAPDRSPYDVDAHLAALVPLVAPGSLVVGHSTGGILAAALAARRPELVGALLLVSLPAYPDEATARREIGALGLLARLTVQDHPAARLVCEAMCHLRPLTIAAAGAVVRDMPRQVAADAARHTWESYRGTLVSVVVAHRVEGDLAAFAGPVSLLHGRHDETAPPAHVERLAGQSARVAVEFVDGDHHLPVRRADLVAAAVARAAG